MATTAIPQGTKWWNGGRSPFNASYGKVMMWYFLMSDAFTFGAFLISYGTVRFLIFSSVTMVLAVHEGHKMNRKGVEKYMLYTILGGIAFLACQAWEWTHLLTGEHIVMLENGTLSTLTTTTANNPFGSAVPPDLVAAALVNTPHDQLVSVVNTLHEGGVAHNTAAMSKAELVNAIQAAEIHVNNPGPKAFGSFFFEITGFHGFHVICGVIINIIMYIKTRMKHFELRGHYEMIEKAGLYWHFVDLVWVFVFLCFYLV